MKRLDALLSQLDKQRSVKERVAHVLWEFFAKGSNTQENYACDCYELETHFAFALEPCISRLGHVLILIGQDAGNLLYNEGDAHCHINLYTHACAKKHVHTPIHARSHTSAGSTHAHDTRTHAYTCTHVLAAW